MDDILSTRSDEVLKLKAKRNQLSTDAKKDGMNIGYLLQLTELDQLIAEKETIQTILALLENEYHGVETPEYVAKRDQLMSEGLDKVTQLGKQANRAELLLLAKTIPTWIYFCMIIGIILIIIGSIMPGLTRYITLPIGCYLFARSTWALLFGK